MRTITFEIHLITPTSPRNTLATIFKNILILFAFIFFAYFFSSSFEHIMHRHIREREREREREKKYPFMLSHKHHNFAMPKHTDVMHDWQALVVR